MKLTYGQLIEELQERAADELYDIAEMAKRFAVEKERDAIRQNIEESIRELQEGKLPAPTSDFDELWQRFEKEK